MTNINIEEKFGVCEGKVKNAFLSCNRKYG